MKLKYLIFIVLIISCTKSFSQLSSGGSPVSFQKNIISLLNTNLPVYTLPVPDINRLAAEDMINDQSKEIPWRFGFPHDIEIDILKSGVSDILPNGSKMWRQIIFGNGALSLNFRFSTFHLPVGAKLFFYSSDKKNIYGAFTSQNNRSDKIFATALFEGDAIIIEYYEPANVSFNGSVILDRIVYGYRNAFEYAKGFGSSGSCEINAACPESQGWDDQIRSVCMLVVNNNAFCTGALVNNTSNDGAPYVLTAKHCSNSNNFSSWVFWFNWQSLSCSNPETSPPHDQVTISGCELKARNAGSDFCLVRMNDTPPQSFHVFYAGWDRTGLPTSSTVCIHHPRGDIKKITFSDNQTESEIYSGASCWRADWTLGVTENGSSGSPLFSAEKRIIGQLYGGPSSCAAAPEDRYDYYGQFSVSWDGDSASVRLKDWLDPANTGLQTLEGYNPPMMQYDAQAVIAFIPEAFYCTAQSISPKVIIRNLGMDTLTNLKISYNIDGNSFTEYNWTGALALTQRDTVDLPTFIPVAGNHEFKFWVSLPNGAEDLYHNNDTFKLNFNVGGKPLPVSESFEYSSFPPQSWSVVNPDTATTWSRRAVVTLNSGGHAAFIFLYFYTKINEKDHLITPVINLSASESPRLYFNVAYCRKNENSRDTLKIFVSNDCGQTFDSVPIYMKTGTDLATSNDLPDMSFIPGNASYWRQDSVSLLNYLGQSLQFKFTCISGGGNNLYLDNINVDFGSGIQNESLDNFITVYPNPANGFLNIYTEDNKPAVAYLLNLQGEVLAQTSIQNQTAVFNLKNYSNGIYIVKIAGSSGFVVKRVVKM